jgi:hypothetical protein
MRGDSADVGESAQDLAPCGSSDDRSAGNRRSRGSLEDRISAALCRAYAREDRRLHGAPVAIAQTLVTRGLACIVSRGRYERYALSAEGELQAAELTRGLLARRGRSSTPALPLQSGPLAVKAALYDRLVDFLAGPRSSAGTLNLDFPADEVLTSGLRVKIERCGPGKLLLHVVRSK